MTEIWKDIEGYEGLYQVSNLGRVKSLDRMIKCEPKVTKGHGANRTQYHMKERILKLGMMTSGYYKVYLCKDGEHKQCGVHRLVAKAFLPNPDNLPEVNHKDENRLNNCVDNLEWCTRQYNLNYGNRSKNQSESLKKGGKVKRGNNPKARKVICDGVVYDCITDCAEVYGVNSATLCGYLRGLDPMPKRWKALGLAYYTESEVA